MQRGNETSEKTSEKTSALDIAISSIEKDHGKGAIMRLGDKADKVETHAIPTGSLTLDLALGVGGLPRGRVTEIYGAESGGNQPWQCISWRKPKELAELLLT